LAHAFEKHIFTNDDLQDLLQATVSGLIGELEGQDNALLVQIRADWSEEDLPALRSLGALQSNDAFQGEYRKVLAEVIPIISRD
jgi:hypothetical protein